MRTKNINFAKARTIKNALKIFPRRPQQSDRHAEGAAKGAPLLPARLRRKVPRRSKRTMDNEISVRWRMEEQ